jgi:hypothetical protein
LSVWVACLFCIRILFIQLLFSCVGLSCRFGCIWFMYSWMVCHPHTQISSTSSTIATDNNTV